MLLAALPLALASFPPVALTLATSTSWPDHLNLFAMGLQGYMHPGVSKSTDLSMDSYNSKRREVILESNRTFDGGGGGVGGGG